MAKQKVPEGAVWWSVEVEDQPGAWRRLEHERARWWSVDTTDNIAEAAADLVAGVKPGTRCRIAFAPRDRRLALGAWAPVVAGVVATEDVAPAPSSPTAPPPQPPPQPATNAGVPMLGLQHVPMSELGPLATLIYLHNMAQQDLARVERVMMASHELAITTERARSDQAQKAMELHFRTLGQERDKVERILAEQANRERQEAGAGLAALTSKLDELTEEIEELSEERDEPGPEATDVERVIGSIKGLVTSIAESPVGAQLGQALAAALAKKVAPGAAAG